MKVHNTTKSDLGLGSGFIVPAGGSLEIEEEQLEQLARSKVVRAWAEAGWIVADGDMPAPAEGEGSALSRAEAIAEVIGGLERETGFTQSGKPEVDAINAALPEGMAPVDAAERDAVWAGIPQE